MSSDPLLSVVIVSYNVRALTLQCIHGLVERAGLRIEIVVIDNASSDDTVHAVRQSFPEVRVIANTQNVGFPRASNHGARVSRGRYILFLNPDTLIGTGTLPACVDELNANSDVGVVGCRLTHPDGRVQYEGGRNAYLLRDLVSETLLLDALFPVSRWTNHHHMGHWDHQGVRDVEAISGAFMMVRRSVFDAVGGLPEDVFMYHEDLSFCLKVRRSGWRIRYRGDLATVHLIGQSSCTSPVELSLLECDAKVRFIEEAQGRTFARTARVILAGRSLLRIAASLGVAACPWSQSLQRRYPRRFNVRRHWLALLWSLHPQFVRQRIPSVEAHGSA